MGSIRAPFVVLLVSLGFAVSLAAATSGERNSGERDQRAHAIAALIAAGLRLPAERQLAEFAAVEYPADDAVLAVVLRFLYLERFSSSATIDQGAKEAELKRLREQVARFQQNRTLSAVARAVLARGTGTSTDLVNAIARVMHPDDAPPIVPLAAEKSQRLREQVARLIAVVEDEFHQSFALVQAHDAADVDAWDLPEGSQQQRVALQAAVERRLAALRPLRTGMLVLREVVARGNDFGIDPQPVRERLRALFAAKPPMATSASLVELLADWDFAWGETSPVLGEWCAALLGDALVLGSSAIRPEEVDRIQQRALALDPRQQREARVQLDVLGLQVRTRTDAMRWRLQRGDRSGFAEAWQLWQEFERKASEDQRLVPGRTPQLAVDIARLHLMAARIAVGMEQYGEAGVILQRYVATGPTPPFVGIAKRWLAHFLACGAGQESSVAHKAMDPAQAIALARAFLDEAAASSDAVAARRQHLEAAAVLRSGILGLHEQRGDARVTAEHLAQLYHLYVITLSRLEMRHHAVVAALVGTDQALRVIERLGQQKQPNPWKNLAANGRIGWDDRRITPLRLATDGMIIASQLKARDPGLNAFFLATLDRLKRLEPSGGGDLRRQQILGMVGEEDYEGALREAEHLLRERPDQDLWVGTLRNTAVTAWAEQLRRDRDTTKADDLLARLVRDNALLLDRMRGELAQPDLPPTRRDEVERTLDRIQVADIDILLARQDHDAAITRITVLLDEPSPGDVAQIARLQERLAQAIGQWIDTQQLTAATPLPILQSIGERLEQTRAVLQKRDGTLPLNAAKRLALAYHRLRGVLSTRVGLADDAVLRLVRTVDRGFAESFAPTIDDRTPAGNLLVLGNTWWDLGEQAKAIAPYERHIAKVLDEPAVAAFVLDRRAWLAPRTAALTIRAEFRARWETIVASCIGDGAKPADLRAASAQIVALRTGIDAAKPVLGGETHLRLITAVGEVDAVVRKLLGVAQARQRLAESYRAIGRPESAIPHLQQLCAQEPEEQDHRLALVLAIHASQQPSSRAELEQARTLAVQIRAARQGTTDKAGYWEASLLVLEFSLLLGDHRLVDDTLAFMSRNRSDLSRDLIAPPVAGDDRRVRRPLGTSAVMLARRFLDIYGKAGITTRPPFRIEQVAIGNEHHPLFVDSGAPVPVARMITTPDELKVQVYVVDEGVDAPPQAVP